MGTRLSVDEPVLAYYKRVIPFSRSAGRPSSKRNIFIVLFEGRDKVTFTIAAREIRVHRARNASRVSVSMRTLT